MGNNKIIGAKIKNIRESKQLSIEEVAERSGLGIEQIERIEGNLDFPSLAPLIKIARVLGVRLGTFLDDQAELGPVVCRKKDSEADGIGFTNNATQGHKHMDYHSLSQDKSGRGLTHDELHAIAQGRVWTGEDALKIGLVDVLGGLEDAIRIAAQKAGIEKYNLTEYPVVKSPIEELFAEFTTEVKARLLKEELGTFYTTWEQMKNKVENQGLLARIPYDIAFH